MIMSHDSWVLIMGPSEQDLIATCQYFFNIKQSERVKYLAAAIAVAHQLCMESIDEWTAEQEQLHVLLGLINGYPGYRRVRTVEKKLLEDHFVWMRLPAAEKRKGAFVEQQSASDVNLELVTPDHQLAVGKTNHL